MSSYTLWRTKGDGIYNLAFPFLLQEEVYWWTPLVKESCPEENDIAKPILSGKMSMLINILRESESVGDKILVFSQSLASLDMIEEYLSYENDLAKEVCSCWPIEWW